MPLLYVLSGPSAGDTYEVKDGTTLVGRGPDNDLQIIEQSISRKHARLLVSGDCLFIEDLGSQNGTLLNGHPISSDYQVEVKEGDFISMGGVLMSLGKPYAEDGMVTQYSISLKERPEEPAKHLLHKDRRITDREKLETIYEVSTLLMQSLDIDEIGEKILDSVFSCIKSIDSAALLLVDQDTGELRQVTARSREHGKEFEMTYSRTISNRVILEGKAITMSDTNLADETDLSESMILMRIKSVMCVPLISKTDVHGVIYVHSTSVPHGFSKSDLQLLSALSSPAALAIENALLYATHKRAEQALQKVRDELEIGVRERTEELSQANALLKQEIAIRAQAEENLRTLHEQLKEANKNLELAYTHMREAKDRLSSQLYEDEIAVLTDEKGLILAMTEKALETFGRTRFDLFGKNIAELFSDEAKASIVQDIQNTRLGVFEQTFVHFKKDRSSSGQLQVRFFPISSKTGKMLLALMRHPEKEVPQ
ncbi:MAG: FHA domain-containing protein [Deltaproteobacteria bacterium]|jgi:PAS domain S-box-containing protein|nr:FHA domain-containing protein [Deltaproteobacteria bacterium]NTV58237.1 FHA domain-containing protein [Deltaproteobacteria bacterium]